MLPKKDINMKTIEPFWVTLQSFRDDTFAVQMLIIAAYLGILFLIARREGVRTDVIVKIILSAIFIFNGIACFLMYFGKIPIAKFFAGPLYIAIGYLFIVDIYAKRIHFTFNISKIRRFFSFLFIILSFLFPVFGILSGHGMIALPGVPCPLAIFTLAILSASMPRVDNIVVFMLLSWVLVNVPKIFGHVECYEEIIFILAGAYILGLNRVMTEKNIGDEHAST